MKQFAFEKVDQELGNIKQMAGSERCSFDNQKAVLSMILERHGRLPTMLRNRRKAEVDNVDSVNL